MTADRNHWEASTRYQLHAISRPVYDLLKPGRREDRPPSVRPLARFQRALNLTLIRDSAGGDTVIALITPDLAIGPFHMVVDRLPPPLGCATYTVWWEEETLHIGPWALQSTQHTEVWEPEPDWESMVIRRHARAELERATKALRDADTRTLSRVRTLMPLPERHRRALIRAVVAQDLDAVRVHAAALSGLGPGLTPSGDDYLAGLMLALWATHHPKRNVLCATICDAARGQTTQLSMAFLEAARRGEADQRWHALLAALSAPSKVLSAITQAVERVSAYGATSGLDMLGGFVEGIEGDHSPAAPLTV